GGALDLAALAPRAGATRDQLAVEHARPEGGADSAQHRGWRWRRTLAGLLRGLGDGGLFGPLGVAHCRLVWGLSIRLVGFGGPGRRTRPAERKPVRPTPTSDRPLRARGPWDGRFGRTLLLTSALAGCCPPGAVEHAAVPVDAAGPPAAPATVWDRPM